MESDRACAEPDSETGPQSDAAMPHVGHAPIPCGIVSDGMSRPSPSSPRWGLRGSEDRDDSALVVVVDVVADLAGVEGLLE